MGEILASSDKNGAFQELLEDFKHTWGNQEFGSSSKYEFRDAPDIHTVTHPCAKWCMWVWAHNHLHNILNSLNAEKVLDFGII